MWNSVSAPSYPWKLNVLGTIANPTEITIDSAEPVDPDEGDIWIETA